MNINIYFDGGCHPNPGKKYGSYDIFINGLIASRKIRLSFGHGTSNEAEFESLEAAIKDAIFKICELDGVPGDCCVDIKTDSMIVLNRLTKKNKIHKKPAWRESSERMFNLANRCLNLLVKFKQFRVIWVARYNNVERFGH